MKKNKDLGSVIRIDIPAPAGKVGTHGWQARIPTGEPRKYHSKLFSDSKYGNSEKARTAAEKYRREYLEQHPEIYDKIFHPPYQKEPTVRNTSGRVGVYRSHNYHKRGHKQEFWGAFCPVGPYGGHWFKRFYISTHGEEEARRLAEEFREMWEQAADKGPAAIEEFFNDYHDGYL